MQSVPSDVHCDTQLCKGAANFNQKAPAVTWLYSNSKAIWYITFYVIIQWDVIWDNWLTALFIDRAKSLFTFIVLNSCISSGTSEGVSWFQTFLLLSSCVALLELPRCCITLSLGLTLLLQTFVNPVKYLDLAKKSGK